MSYTDDFSMANVIWLGDNIAGESCLSPSDLGVGRCGEECGSSESSSSEQQLMDGETTWPRLSYTTKGVNSSHYLVDISWTPPPVGT